MVEYHPALDHLFQALADPTRRAMLQRLADDGECPVGELAAPFDMSLAAASKHIRVLERAGLVEREVRGRLHLCRLDARPLRTGQHWLQQYRHFWERRLDALANALERDDAPTTPGAGAPDRAAVPAPPPGRPVGNRGKRRPRR